MHRCVILALGMLELRMLSRPRVILDGKTVTEFVSSKALALLCYLALNPVHQSREALAGMLWGTLPDKRARGNLRVLLHNLRQLAPGYIETTRHKVTFVAEKPHWIDVNAFEEAAQQEQTPQSWTDAVALYEEDFLQEVRVEAAPALEGWLERERQRLRLALVDMLRRLSEWYEYQGRWKDAAAATRRSLEIEPWREEGHRRLMLLLARQEKYSAALRQYDRCRQALSTNLNIEPAQATRTLYERIRRRRSRPQTAIPSPPTPLFGREHTLKALRSRMLTPGCRLLTLYGPGGIGKTRLALSLVQRMRKHFLDGVCYIPLTEVSPLRHVALAIADALDISLEGPRAFDLQLLQQLKGAEVLLVLDNVEQRLDAAEFVQRLLATVPDAHVLAVSRVILNIAEEWTYELGGLALPDLTQPDPQAPAAQLFLRQAQQQQPDFTPEGDEWHDVAKICHLLEGIPLALQQAASWLRVLSCRELVRELEVRAHHISYLPPQRHSRQHSMQAVLEQSWQMLDENERSVLVRLSVLRVGFTREAARAVAGATLPVLAELAGHSWLSREPGADRFTMHEILRRFAYEKLAQQPGAAAETKMAHARFFARFIEQKQRGLQGPQLQNTIAAIARELGNISAGWRYALDYELLDLALQYLNSFFWIYESAGWYAEGLETSKEALERLPAFSEGSAPAALVERMLAIAMTSHGWFLFRTGDYRASTRELAAAVEQSRSHGSRLELGLALFFYGFNNQLMGRNERALNLLDESHRLFEREKWVLGTLLCKGVLTLARLALGQYEEAEALVEHARPLARNWKGHRIWSNHLYLEGNCAQARGDLEAAEHYFRASLKEAQEIGDTWNVALCHHFLGLLETRRQNYLSAKEWEKKALVLMERLGEKLGMSYCLSGVGWAELGGGDPASARDSFRRALALASEISVPPQMLEALAGFGASFLHEGRKEASKELLSLVASHPATPHAVHQQARNLLGPQNRDSDGHHPDPDASLDRLVSALLEEEGP